jgi:hypothetical protein
MPTHNLQDFFFLEELPKKGSAPECAKNVTFEVCQTKPVEQSRLLPTIPLETLFQHLPIDPMANCPSCLIK